MDVMLTGAFTQFATIRRLFYAHEKLVTSYSSDRQPGALPMASVFHLDDFFDRYPGEKFESAHVPFVQVDGAEEMDL
jgi:hypothetical protein